MISMDENRKNIILSEVTQAPKGTLYVFSYTNF